MLSRAPPGLLGSRFCVFFASKEPDIIIDVLWSMILDSDGGNCNFSLCNLIQFHAEELPGVKLWKETVLRVESPTAVASVAELFITS